MEWELETVNERLDRGAATFSDLRRATELLTPKPTPPWKIVGIVVTVAVLLAGWVWQAAKYPNRDEFNSVREEVGILKIEQVKMQADIDAIVDSQARVERGIEEIKQDLRNHVTSVPAAPRNKKP